MFVSVSMVITFCVSVTQSPEENGSRLLFVRRELLMRKDREESEHMVEDSVCVSGKEPDNEHLTLS